MQAVQQPHTCVLSTPACSLAPWSVEAADIIEFLPLQFYSTSAHFSYMPR